MAGLDPELAWDRTPGELAEYVDAYADRMERLGYLLYNHAVLQANLRAGRRVSPAEAFPGVIRMRVQTEDEMLAAAMAWDDCKLFDEEE